jgi:hypothetical protein
MAQRYGSRRGYGSRSVTAGRVARPNKRPGPCKACGEEIPAGAGQLWREASGEWSVVHVQEAQGGWLMHPGPVTGGCPESTDKRNAELHASGFFGPGAQMPVSERVRIARTAETFAASAQSEAPARRASHAYTSSGARMTSRQGRCEDAPCCGCCD